MRRHVLLALSCILSLHPLAKAQTAPAATPATMGLARDLLRAMNAESTFIAGVELGFATAKKKDASVPQVFYDSTLARMRRSAPEMVDSLAPLYATKFTEAELRDLIAFYRSATGRRFTALQTDIMQESGKIGQRWGMRVSMDTMKDLMDKGLMSPPEE